MRVTSYYNLKTFTSFTFRCVCRHSFTKRTIPLLMNIFTGLTPTTFFVPVPRQIMDFERRLSLYFCMFNELRGEVIVRLVEGRGDCPSC